MGWFMLGRGILRTVLPLTGAGRGCGAAVHFFLSKKVERKSQPGQRVPGAGCMVHDAGCMVLGGWARALDLQLGRGRTAIGP